MYKRQVSEVRLQRGLPALHAAQVLAHEFMHAWLWLQGFPHMDHALEEGLCELGSYVYLLSCLHEPPDDGAAVLERDEAALRAEFRSLETNAHPHYGGGFRACVRSLRGREIHALLSHVREHARLPPPVV